MISQAQEPWSPPTPSLRDIRIQGVHRKERPNLRLCNELAPVIPIRRTPTGSPYGSWVSQFEPSGPSPSVRKMWLEAQLERLARLSPGWDTYSADPPNKVAVEAAQGVLAALVKEETIPDRIVPSVEGGVAVILAVRPYYAAVECFNEGDVIASFADGGRHNEAWETGVKPGDIRSFLERVRDLARG